jgi:hypothetical protein
MEKSENSWKLGDNGSIFECALNNIIMEKTKCKTFFIISLIVIVQKVYAQN